jgi:hypothetical protein
MRSSVTSSMEAQIFDLSRWKDHPSLRCHEGLRAYHLNDEFLSLIRAAELEMRETQKRMKARFT